MTKPAGPSEFELTGGALCLDFVNTLEDRPSSTREHLTHYGDLLRFSRAAGSLSDRALDQLERLHDDCGRCAEPIHAKVIDLREALYRIFSAVAAGAKPADADLAGLNRVLHKALCQLEIRSGKPGYSWGWGGPVQALDRPLWPIARSAAELLTSKDLRCLRQCDGESCSWLFLDRSRNRRRRWCDMATCGNRAKARRYYRRRKVGRDGGGSSA